jgi:hypothetical protein
MNQNTQPTSSKYIFKMEEKYALFLKICNNQVNLFNLIHNFELFSILLKFYSQNENSFIDKYVFDITEPNKQAELFVLFKEWGKEFGFPQKFIHLQLKIMETKQQTDQQHKQINITTKNDGTSLPLQLPKNSKLFSFHSNILIKQEQETNELTIIQEIFFEENDMPEFIEKKIIQLFDKIIYNTKMYLQNININTS